MARATNGLGQFRGKVGAVVFRVSQGQQIASAYQPAVKNPKSNLQTAQRNKMYLASQLSKIVPREDIIGLAPNASVRDRRGLFIKNIIDNTVSTLDDKLFVSKIDYANVAFSHGTNMIFSIVPTGENLAPDQRGIRIVFNDSLTEEEYNRMAIKAVTFNVYPDGVKNYKSSWLELPPYADLTNNNLEIQGLGLYGYPTYLIPVMLKDNVRYSREKKTLVQLVDGGEFAIAGEYNINNAVLSWGQSVGSLVGDFEGIKPPTGDEDEVVNPDGPNFPNLG